MPAAQLPPSIDPSMAAMSMCSPIIGATMYIIPVITSVPTKPPSAARPKFTDMRPPATNASLRLLRLFDFRDGNRVALDVAGESHRVAGELLEAGEILIGDFEYLVAVDEHVLGAVLDARHRALL